MTKLNSFIVSLVLNSVCILLLYVPFDRKLNSELYAKRLQKLIYLYLFTDCFMKISIPSSQLKFLPRIGEKSSWNSL